MDDLLCSFRINFGKAPYPQIVHHICLDFVKIPFKLAKRGTDNIILAWVHPAVLDMFRAECSQKTGLKSVQLELKEDGITDILA